MHISHLDQSKIFSEAETVLARQDPVLNRIIDETELPALLSTDDVFFDLVSCIMDQQIHYRSKGAYLNKLNDLLGGEIATPSLILSLEEQDFVFKKISRIKFRAVHTLAQYWEDNNLYNVNWQSLSDEEVKAKLLPIKGIGDWSVDMILLYTLGRPDIFNPNDYHLKRIMSALYGFSSEQNLIKEMNSIAKRWSPHRSLAVRYLLTHQKSTLRK